MGKFKDTILNLSFGFGSLAFALFMIYGTVFGILHSARHHTTKDTIVSIFMPPWAWWRSIEMYWHEDSDNSNEVLDLSNDLNDCLVLIEMSLNDSELEEFKKEYEIIHKRIRNYPDDKLGYLAKGCRAYYTYANSLHSDGVLALKNYIATGEYKLIMSDETLTLKNELEYYKLSRDGDILWKMAQKMSDSFKEKAVINDETIEKLEQFLANKKELDDQKNVNIDHLFIALFNEEF